MHKALKNAGIVFGIGLGLIVIYDQFLCKKKEKVDEYEKTNLTNDQCQQVIEYSNDSMQALKRKLMYNHNMNEYKNVIEIQQYEPDIDVIDQEESNENQEEPEFTIDNNLQNED
jgi:hypothetical protein